jgi:tetratricopeptide (TPR) repeat protein
LVPLQAAATADVDRGPLVAAVLAAAARAAERQSLLHEGFRRTAGDHSGGFVFCDFLLPPPLAGKGKKTPPFYRHVIALIIARMSPPTFPASEPIRTARSAAGLVACIAASLALAGCSTMLDHGGLAPEATYSASPANIASLTDVIQSQPNDPQAYNMRGTVLASSGRRKEALIDFNKAIQLDPKYAEAYANRGLVHRQDGKPDLALKDYDAAIRIDPNYAAAYLGRGLAWRDKKQNLKALEDINKAIAIRPDNAQAYYNRGLLYQGDNQHQFAIDDFATAITLAPREADPYLARALSYIAAGDLKAAASDLDNAVQIDEQNFAAWTSRGLAYERMGDKQKAAGSYAKALNIQQNYAPAADGFRRVGGEYGKTYQAF